MVKAAKAVWLKDVDGNPVAPKTGAKQVFMENGQTVEQTVSELSAEKVPDYVKTEAEEVLGKVVAAQSTRTFNIAVMTDLHNNGGVSDANILHACQGIGYIADRMKIDVYACLGDHTDSAGTSDWSECLADILACNSHKRTFIKNTDIMELMGNHDFKSSRSPMTFQSISAYSTDVVWGNRLGGYFHKDFEDYKLRIIGLNTSEIGGASPSADQYNWFIDALDLSEKTDAEDWQTLVLSHIPLDWSGFKFTYILNAYINGTSWTDGTYSCDYTDKNQAKIIAAVHGHIHNLLVDKLYLGDINASAGQIDLYRIAIPETTESYGNHYAAPYKQDTRYGKTAGTANDTSFNVLCIDLDNHRINAVCYGAGYDRIVEYADFGENDNTGYTNIIDTVGYTDGYRLSTSSGNLSQLEGYTTTGLITVPGGARIRTKGVNFNYQSGTCNIVIYDSTGTTKIAAATLYGGHSGWNAFAYSFDDDGNMVMDYTPSSGESSHIKICGYGSGANLIVTINEEIPD